MHHTKRNIFFMVSAVALFLLVPVFIVSLQTSRETRSRATASTTLTFAPASVQETVGDIFTLDIMVNPGQNYVSGIKLDIQYDPTKLELYGNTSYATNSAAFGEAIEGPVFTSGRILVSQGVRDAQSVIIGTTVKAATLTFRAKSDASTYVTFGPDTEVYSTAPNDKTYENVLFNKIPAAVTIVPVPTITPTPTLTPTNTPIPTNTPTPTKTPTPTVTPTPSNTPTPIPTNTSTPTPVNTRVNLQVFLHGIGRGGDNVNATGLGNITPRTTTRSVTIAVFNSLSQLAVSKIGNVSYNTCTDTSCTNGGYFTGSIDLGTALASGDYTFKVKSPGYLRRQIGQVTTIGQPVALNGVYLTTGDVNVVNGTLGDNLINKDDYQVVLDCYADFQTARNCSDANKKASADFNDDGKVNFVDYNLWLRDFLNRPGD